MEDYVRLYLGNSKLHATINFQAHLSPRPAKRQAKHYRNLLMAPGLEPKLVFGEFLRQVPRITRIEIQNTQQCTSIIKCILCVRQMKCVYSKSLFLLFQAPTLEIPQIQALVLTRGPSIGSYSTQPAFWLGGEKGGLENLQQYVALSYPGIILRSLPFVLMILKVIFHITSS